jgi:hypothetical protein
VFVVVQFAVAVCAQDYAALVDFYVRFFVPTVLYKGVYVAFLWVIRVCVVKINYGWM